ncbi:MAG: hypothetical protein SGARI_005481 [Bacillariaceae sp.]
MVNLGGHKSSRSMLMGSMIGMAVLLLGTTLLSASSSVTHAQTSPVKANSAQRTLQECAVTVEILVDGCRRVDQTNDTDLLVTAPSVLIYDGEVVDMNTTASVEDECVTEYQGDLVFSLSETDNVVVAEAATERQQQSPAVAVPSFSTGDSDQFGQYESCFRAVEGRPYVDSKGQHVHAPGVREATAAWSASTDDHVFEKDAVLGKQWLDRAVGEHASVPAFAAFTIALMSNNAPPDLVRDALSAAQDEVRHAETSFEVASLLLGETVEPGPLPPSSLSFEHDITALALAAAKEGCVDETLSALVAGLEVDFQIDESASLSDATKSVLKEKMRTIALEETRHSGLAWRTVRWACSVDEAACEAVQNEVFDTKYLEYAFSKRFSNFNRNMVKLAKQVWDEVHSTLIPIVFNGANEAQELRTSGVFESIPVLPCLSDESFAEQENMSILEEMGLRIISQLSCST